MKSDLIQVSVCQILFSIITMANADFAADYGVPLFKCTICKLEEKHERNTEQPDNEASLNAASSDAFMKHQTKGI